MTGKKRPFVLVLTGIAIAFMALAAFTRITENNKTVKRAISCNSQWTEKPCVFKTFMGMETFDTAAVKFDSRLTEAAIRNGLNWIMQAQQNNGGWGAGSHYHQEISDPHAVPADPAATALVGMALL